MIGVIMIRVIPNYDHEILRRHKMPYIYRITNMTVLVQKADGRHGR